MERWEYPYNYDEKICDATDEELLTWADADETWNEFSCGCLHDLAWRLDIPWILTDEDGEEDPCETFDRIKETLYKKLCCDFEKMRSGDNLEEA